MTSERSKLKCFACKGPYHESSGHLFAPDVAYCGPCIRHFLTWWKGHERRKWGGLHFYGEAWTSIVDRSTVRS